MKSRDRTLFVVAALMAGLIRCSSESTNNAAGGGGGAAGSDASVGATGGTGATGGSGGSTDAQADQNPPGDCNDGTQNGNEIAVDCGGGCLCATGQPCQQDIDCKQAECVAGKCQPPNCTDSITNGQESDVDCGGAACPKCPALKACNQADDCVTGVCTQSICQQPSCTDNTRNGDETDVDCGGTVCTTKCANGKACSVAGDCASQICQATKCVPTDCTDKLKNGDETDVDCGGSCGACDDGKTCNQAADCSSGVCTGNSCAVPICTDKVQNGTETDVDCGGGGCPACADTKACSAGTDCQSMVCLGSVCQAPTCTDTKKNGAETDVDCGGGSCTPCGNGKGCTVADDCAGGACTSLLCGPWAKSYGSDKVDYSTDIAIDSKGNIVLAGVFNGTVDFGKGALTSKGSSDIFVAKLSPTGTTIWAKSFGGSSAELAIALTVNSQDDVFVGGGTISTTLDFGGGSLPNAGGYDAFVAKLSGVDGSHAWSQSFGGTSDDFVRGIAIDGNGDVLTGGQFQSASFTFGSETFTSAGAQDGYVMKLTAASGSPVWSVSFGGSGLDTVRAVAALPGGDAAFVGYFSSAVTVGTTSVPFSAGSDVIVGRLAAATGKESWVKGFGGPNADQGYAIASDGLGGLIIGGRFSGTMAFGGPALTSKAVDGFIVKLDAVNGAHTWSTQQQSTADEWLLDVATDSAGDVYGVGYTLGAVDAGGGALTGGTGRTPFVVKLGKTAGAHLYSASFPATASPTASTAHAIAVSAISRAVVVTGNFDGSLTAPTGTLTSLGSDEIYLMNLGPLP